MEDDMSGAAARTGNLRERRGILIIQKATRYLHRNTKQARSYINQNIITYIS